MRLLSLCIENVLHTRLERPETAAALKTFLAFAASCLLGWVQSWVYNCVAVGSVGAQLWVHLSECDH